jgi:hypothetical protein
MKPQIGQRWLFDNKHPERTAYLAEVVQVIGVLKCKVLQILIQPNSGIADPEVYLNNIFLPLTLTLDGPRQIYVAYDANLNYYWTYLEGQDNPYT